MIKWIGFGASIIVIVFLLVAIHAILKKEALFIRFENNLANKLDSTVKYLEDYQSKEISKPLKRLMYSNELEGYAREYIRNHQILVPNEELIVLYDESQKRNATTAAIITTKRVIYYMDSLIISSALKDIDNQFDKDSDRDSLGIQFGNSSGFHIRISFDNNQDKELFSKALRDTKSKSIEPEQRTYEKPFSQDDKLYDSLLENAR